MELKQNGTTQAHGRTWPLLEQPGYAIEVLGYIDAGELNSSPWFGRVGDEQSEETRRTNADKVAKVIEQRAQELLDNFAFKSPVKVRVYRVTSMVMHPEDQAENNALDEAAIANC